MRMVFFAALVAFAPGWLAAHSWLDNAEPLTSEAVEEVISRLDALERGAFITQPSKENSLEFFEEAAIRMDDESGEVRRTLFMYEAIRRNIFGAKGLSLDADVSDWIERIHGPDLGVVAEYTPELDQWFDRQMTGEDQ